MVTPCNSKWSEKVLNVLNSMDRQCIQANFYAYSRLLQECSDLKTLVEGKLVHAHIINNGKKLDICLRTTLVSMYAKCGSIGDARQVFDKISEPDVLAWNVMITAYAKNSPAEKACELFWQMEQRAVVPNSVTFVSVLKASSNFGDLERGRQIHAHILKTQVKPNLFMENALIDMYTNCVSLQDACQVFDKIPGRDVISWNTMIAGWTKHAHPDKVFHLLRQMESEGFQPNEITFLSLLQACADIGDPGNGKRIHAQLSKIGFKPSTSVGNMLVDMYCKCGSINDAFRVFDSMLKRDVISWNAMIAGYAKNGSTDEVLKFFQRMRQEGLNPDELTFSSILNVCTSLGDLKQGKQVHAHLLESGIEPHVSTSNVLVDMYGKCGNLEDAWNLFDKLPKQDVVAWTAMIAGYGKHGHAEEALRLFYEMESEGIAPNEITFLSILEACASAGNLEEGRRAHFRIVGIGIISNIIIENALVTMYAKCGCIDDACRLFDSMVERDIVSWTVMIAAYATHKHYEKVFVLLQRMILEDVKPDKVTFVKIINVCAHLAALDQGRLVHAHTRIWGFVSDAFVGNALIDMYSKCASLNEARCVLDGLSKPDIVSWNTMIRGYAQHGQAEEAFKLITRMQEEGFRLNDITFLGILSACSHSGLVYEGCHSFDFMLQEHGVLPAMEHYVCMVDLFGRAGQLSKAEDFIQKVPIQPSAAVWHALLGACRIHGNVDLAKRAAEGVLRLEPQNAAAFVLLSNIYAEMGIPVI